MHIHILVAFTILSGCIGSALGFVPFGPIDHHKVAKIRHETLTVVMTNPASKTEVVPASTLASPASTFASPASTFASTTLNQTLVSPACSSSNSISLESGSQTKARMNQAVGWSKRTPPNGRKSTLIYSLCLITAFLYHYTRSIITAMMLSFGLLSTAMAGNHGSSEKQKRSASENMH